MIKLIGGDLYQWDTGRIAVVNPETDDIIHEVHFTTKDMQYAYVVSTYEKDGSILCAVPNVILQQEKSVICYEVTKTESGEMSVSTTTLPLRKRNKPQDYAYTEDELKNFDRLEALIPTKMSQLEQDIELGASDYDSLNNTPIINVSSNSDSPLALRDIETGVYRLSGVFVPFSGSDVSISFSNKQLVNVVAKTDGTHIQIFYPINNVVQFAAIMADDTADGGYTYEMTDIKLNDLAARADIPTDEYINGLIDTKLGVIENGSY